MLELQRGWGWVLAISACTANPGPREPAEPSAVAPTHDRSVRVVEEAGAGGEVVFEFDGLRFATVTKAGRLDVWPAVHLQVGGAWSARVLHVDDQAPDSTPESGWSWALVSAQEHESALIAVLEWRVESPGHELVLVASDDGGRTWVERSRLQKPHYMSEASELVLDARGQGRLTIELVDCADCGIPRGLYHYRTIDGGRTWSEPEHEPNTLVRAQAVGKLRSLP